MAHPAEVAALIEVIKLAREEDRTTREADRAEVTALRKDVRELVKSSTSLNIAMEKSASEHNHMYTEVDEIKDVLHNPTNGLVHKVGELEIAQAEDNRNWLFVSFIASTIFVALVGYYFTVTRPVLAANVQSEKIAELIESIDKKLEGD